MYGELKMSSKRIIGEVGYLIFKFICLHFRPERSIPPKKTGCSCFELPFKKILNTYS